MRICLITAILSCILLIPENLFGQRTQDSTKVDTVKTDIISNIKDSNLTQRIMKSLTRKQPDDPMAAVKSEAAFSPYTGKFIRKIAIHKIDFQQTVYDTTKNIRNTITKLGNKLHGTTKDRVIRDNLFIREGQPLNPYKLADNERHLRDLSFLLDAKIYVMPISGEVDSVDLVVLTRDVFSIGGTINPANPSKVRLRLYDANLAGWGQRLEFNGLVEPDRDPDVIYQFLYLKNSVAGTFINASIGYTQLNNASSYGEEEESAYYLKLDRPLVSPYTRYAGGLELSRNWSRNYFNAHDSLFRDYRYSINDVWVGYNIGANSNNDRSRHFLAIRGFDQHFTRLPSQARERARLLYSNQSAVLGSVTFFNQDFYTAQYIYGFGRTEDVPYGHRITLTGGWTRLMGLSRTYVGFEAEKSIVSKIGEFYNVGMRSGSFLNDGTFEDATFMVSGSVLSRLIPKGQFLFRQSVSADFTRVLRQRASTPLDINDEFGLQYFRADSLWGTKRFHIQSETIAFSPWQFLGFRFAPFAFAEMALIANDHQSIFHDKPYFGLGGGVRTRNENLIFGTVELRVIYFPRTVEDISSFTVRVTGNLRVKYSAGFVRAPELVRYN